MHSCNIYEVGSFHGNKHIKVDAVVESGETSHSNQPKVVLDVRILDCFFPLLRQKKKNQVLSNSVVSSCLEQFAML